MKKTNRRNFLTSSAIVAGGLITSGCKSGTAKPETKSPLLTNDGHIVGHGDFKYKVDKQWAVQDAGKYPVHHCHEMVMDKKGRLIMCTTDLKNNILVFDKSGKVLDAWGHNFPGAHGLTINDEGGTEYLYLTDTVKRQVYKLTMDGEVVLTIDYPKDSGVYENMEAFEPTETIITSTGDILVADGYGSDYIIRYDQKGNYLNHFAGKGDEDGQVQNAHGICIDERSETPSLIVTSRAKQEFKRFSMDGKYMETIPVPGCWVCRPVIKGDNLYAAVIVTKDWWSYDGAVVVLDKNNKVVSLPGAAAPDYSNGTMKGANSDGITFLNPHDVCIDNDENIYVPQWLSGKTYPVRLERV